MLPCEKRQKNVKRETNETIYKCINRDCEAFKQVVTEEACSVCPVRVYAIESPCKQLGKIVTTQEPEPCDECQPIEDQVLADALAKTGGFQTELKPEDTPDGEVPDYPPMSLQLWLYKEALKRWHKEGRPVRSEEEVERILKICKGCDWYDPDRKRCKGCGCRVTDGGIPITNKLKMATEHCPHPEKKW
jgi:hypothetical protein